MSSKSYTYENIQIGNFLVSIGYYLRDFNYTSPTSFSLNQQTPNDPTIGDFFGKLSGKFFIIEFKNDEKNLKSELRKPQRDRLFQKLNGRKELMTTSRDCHFICYPKFENGEMEFNLNPYLAVAIDELKARLIQGVKGFLAKFIEEESIGVDFEEIKNYISLLQSCAEEVGKKSSAGASSGIMMNFDKKGIRYITYDDWDFLDRSIRLERELLQELEIRRNITITRDRSRDRSHEMGM